ncbi:trypsin, alkaline C-like [Leguminivora glycinivorella]|uniref:trypsin, alkaline C-like n=1 Tax=Leguminivora glycinivorella TaxID=1035111 RepID=UPI00200D8D21|nr:trypsin, alkaline C-like [Leguminivora glycinivorella]
MTMLRHLGLFVIFSLIGSHVLAVPNPLTTQRIVGGELTTIEQYPFQVVVLQSSDLSFYTLTCGGTIINARSILTAAHCFTFFTDPQRFQIRVGSSFANRGGVVHNVLENIIHPDRNPSNYDIDVAIMRSASVIVFNEAAQPAPISGPGYVMPDNSEVWATGWGRTGLSEPPSEQLRHVQIWTVNQATCRLRYNEVNYTVTNNMMCSGWLDVGGRDQCAGDSGGPLIHNGVVVGICSWGYNCALARYPGVNVRVSRVANWIQVNA